MPSFEPSAKALSLTAYFLYNTSSPSTTQSIASQLDHRLQLVEFWGITPGSRVLEIGCGQGDCTVVLADAAGEMGHVDALDPGAPDYGSPFTLSQSHSHILSTPLGPRITFHNTTPESYLSSLSPSHAPYDFIILSHCIYYFESPLILPSLITALRNHLDSSSKPKLCIAEWSLHPSSPESVPHVLTVLLLTALEAKRRVSTNGNVRTVVSPRRIVDLVTSTSSSQSGNVESGFKLLKQITHPTNNGLLDAYWEVSDTIQNQKNVLEEMKGLGVSEREIAALRAGYDAVESCLADLEEGERGVRCMDFWAGVFERL